MSRVLLAEACSSLQALAENSLRLAPCLQVLMSDTVGFIQKLPTQLVAAFRATLEEIREAALILHVVDISHPNAAAQSQAVIEVRWRCWQLDLCCPCWLDFIPLHSSSKLEKVVV